MNTNKCQLSIPGLDYCFCAKCGWIITEYGIAYLNKFLAEKLKRTKAETSKELKEVQLYLKRQLLKREQCKIKY